ncbi:hypothetical protein Taro_048725 [Colocasia esculenta]|uniref:Endonuclease/exonuclease/phosphatase domain-containing protein n=1 Tax=Colocasia esculenta TaxID=4460 RepID=A0A843X8W3_COLES|nr:hypothetical protein [Colocasia esculenta]
MGNTRSQTLAIEEEEQKETVASGSSTSGLNMLKASAAVAGMALLAWGSWRLLFGAAADSTDEDEEKRIRVGERLKGNSTGGSGRRLQISEGLGQMCSSHGSGRLWTSPYSGSAHSVLKILSYNVWSEDIMLQDRMDAIGDLIQEHSPDLICFQEVTPEIYEIFENSNWWEAYSSSVPPEGAYKRKYFCMQLSKLPATFSQKRIGLPSTERELCIAEVDVGAGKSLTVATVHLVSRRPNPRHPRQMYSVERIIQVKEALGVLKKHPNVVFGGDMNWDEEVDGLIPLPRGWVDAWEEKKRPAGENGWTFDTVANRMLSCNQPLQKRLDRFLCCLKDFSIGSVEMIGTEAIPGVFYCKERKVGRVVVSDENILPVLPSDHFGLLLTIESHE